MEKMMLREKMRGSTCDQRVLRRATCVSCTGALLSARRSRATTSQITTQSAPMPPSNAKAERPPTATIMKVSNGTKTTGPIELPNVITPRPNARRSGGSQGAAAVTDVPEDGPSPAPSTARVRSKAGKEMTKSVANCTRAQVVARRARTFFVPTTSAQAVTRTDESEKSQKRLPLTRPYWMALRWSSLMIGIAAKPSTALSAKLMTPRAKRKAIITHPNGETRVPCCFRRTRVSLSSDMHFLLLCLVSSLRCCLEIVHFSCTCWLFDDVFRVGAVGSVLA